MHTSTRGLLLTSLAATALALQVACSDDPLAPFQPEVSNVADNFQLQATNVATVTATRTYTWQNTGTRATVNHSTTLTGGTIHLTIRDAAGTVVYDKGLVPSLNEPTSVGTAGSWTVVVSMTGYSGSINFRAQKL